MMDDLESELMAMQETVRNTYPVANRVPTEVSVLHAVATWKAARLQDEASVRMETATKRLATFTMWLMVATGVLAGATVALVLATLGG
jgi:hypothetical protein